MEAIERFAWRAGGFEGWMFGILRNVVLESYRKHRPSASSPRDPVPEPAADDPAVLDRLVAGESAAEVRAAFALLSAEERELLELRVVGELDAKAVGVIVGKRAGAVRMAQARALARLGTLLREPAAMTDPTTPRDDELLERLGAELREDREPACRPHRRRCGCRRRRGATPAPRAGHAGGAAARRAARRRDGGSGRGPWRRGLRDRRRRPRLPADGAHRLSGAPAGVRADGELINHTWGVELLLTVAGWRPGAPTTSSTARRPATSPPGRSSPSTASSSAG